MLLSFLLLILLDTATSLSSDYVEYFPGCKDSKIIISCPHDGTLIPKAIPYRQNGCYNSVEDTCDYHHDCGKSSTKCRATTVRDTYTSKIGKSMKSAIEKLTGCSPHLIVCNLSRKKLDPNRVIIEAAQYDPIAEKAYNEFHGYIKSAHDAVALNGPGLHLDIHGQAHSDKWIEIGYAISRTKLNAGKLDNYKDISSIKALAERLSNKVEFQNLISGAESLGALVEKKGFKTVPSPTYPRPNTGSPGKYYSGGHITKVWGSRDGGDIDCIQFELPRHVRDKHQTSGEKLAEVTVEFMKKYY